MTDDRTFECPCCEDAGFIAWEPPGFQGVEVQEPCPRCAVVAA